jgi:hypothetical protein
MVLCVSTVRHFSDSEFYPGFSVASAPMSSAPYPHEQLSQREQSPLHEPHCAYHQGGATVRSKNWTSSMQYSHGPVGMREMLLRVNIS